MHAHRLFPFAAISLLCLGILLTGCGHKKGGGYGLAPMDQHVLAAVLHDR